MKINQKVIWILILIFIILILAVAIFHFAFSGRNTKSSENVDLKTHYLEDIEYMHAVVEVENSISDTTIIELPFSYWQHIESDILGTYGRDGSGFSVATDITAGTTWEELESLMPDTLTVYDELGHSFEVSVSWHCENYNPDQVAMYALYGTMSPINPAEATCDLPIIEHIVEIKSIDGKPCFGGYYKWDFGDYAYGIYPMLLTESDYKITIIHGADLNTALDKWELEKEAWSDFYWYISFQNLAINWNTTTCNPDTPGTYTVVGKVTAGDLYPEIDFPDIELTVTVR